MPFYFQGVGTSGDMTPSIMVVSEAEAELQREVEELKLRLHMAAEHYKEKYRECQRLRRQVAKLNSTESQGVRTENYIPVTATAYKSSSNFTDVFVDTLQESKRNASTETTQEPLTPSPESPTDGKCAEVNKHTIHIYFI